MKVKKENHAIHALKVLLAFYVVVIHTSLYGKEFLTPLTSTAVPCFFLISGYYLQDNNSK